MSAKWHLPTTTRHNTDSANIWWAVATSIIPLLFSLTSCTDRDIGAAAECEQQFSLSYSSWSDAVDSVLWMRSRIGWTSSDVCSSPVAIKSSSKYSGLFTAVGDVQTLSCWASDNTPRNNRWSDNSCLTRLVGNCSLHYCYKEQIGRQTPFVFV